MGNPARKWWNGHQNQSVWPACNRTGLWSLSVNMGEKAQNTTTETDLGQFDNNTHSTEAIYSGTHQDSNFSNDKNMWGSSRYKRGVRAKGQLCPKQSPPQQA